LEQAAELRDGRQCCVMPGCGLAAGQGVTRGAVPYISEFSPTGQLLFNAQLPGIDITYRAYRLPWHPAT
jgi:hypothetical protein